MCSWCTKERHDKKNQTHTGKRIESKNSTKYHKSKEVGGNTIDLTASPTLPSLLIRHTSYTTKPYTAVMVHIPRPPATDEGCRRRSSLYRRRNQIQHPHPFIIYYEYRTLPGVKAVRKNRALDMFELGDAHVADAPPNALAVFVHRLRPGTNRRMVSFTPTAASSRPELPMLSDRWCP